MRPIDADKLIEEGYVLTRHGTSNCVITTKSIADVPTAFDIDNVVKKLAYYENLDEQGLLLKLPCKVGDTVWVIDEDFECSGKKQIYEAKWVRVTFVQIAKNHSFELRGEVQYQVYDYFYNDGRTMLHGMYVGQHNTKVGEVVFLTREDAEEKLRELQNK